jgi:hypothetical protein
MEILGHSQIGITMDTYGHVFSETQRDAVEGIAGLFDAPTGEQPEQAEEEPAPEGEKDSPSEANEAPPSEEDEDSSPEEGEESPPA